MIIQIKQAHLENYKAVGEIHSGFDKVCNKLPDIKYSGHRIL